MLSFELPARPPFSLSAVVKSHGWVQMAPFSTDPGYASLSYVMRLDSGRVVALTIQEAHPATGLGVSVTPDSPLGAAERAEVSRKVGWMLGLDQDLSAFYALARREPKLAHVEARCQGRVLRGATLFEDVVKTILTTNTLWAATLRMSAALVNHYGEALPGDDPTPAPSRRAFPTPESLAALDEADLRSTARLGYRAPYVLELARAVTAGALDLEALKTSDLPTPQLRKQLLAIKGVGGYAAANLLMLLGRYDFVPVDSWALKVVSHEWHSGNPIPPAAVEAAFERWGEWKGLAYWFWDWSLLQPTPAP